LESALPVRTGTRPGTESCLANFKPFVGLAYQSKDIVFRLIIEYSSLRDFGP